MVNLSPNALLKDPIPNQFPRNRYNRISWNWEALDPDAPDEGLFGNPAAPLEPRAMVPTTTQAKVGVFRTLENSQVLRCTEDGTLRVQESP